MLRLSVLETLRKRGLPVESSRRSLPLPVLEFCQTSVDQFRRIGVLKNACAGVLRKFLEQVIHFVRDAARATLKQPITFPSSLRNRELIQRAHRVSDEQHNVAGAYQHNIASFQTETCVDDQVTGIHRQFVVFHVLTAVTGRRDPHMENTGVMRSLANEVDYPCGSPGQQQQLARGAIAAAKALAFSASAFCRSRPQHRRPNPSLRWQ